MTVGDSCVVDCEMLVTVSPPLCPVEGPVRRRILSSATIIAQEFGCQLFDISPNVIVRYLVNDEEEQAEAVRALLEE